MATKKATDVEIVRAGTEIVLPEGMSFNDGIMWLRRRMEENERVVCVEETIKGYPLDCAHALVAAIAKKYGWADLVPTPGFFGDRPPAMVGVAVGPDKTVQVPWGQMKIPGVSGFIAPFLDPRSGRHVFKITGEVKQKDKAVIKELAQLTRTELKERSLYKGKAVRVSFAGENGQPFHPIVQQPEFLDLSRVHRDELVLSRAVGEQVQDSLFTPIEKLDLCREMGIPLKRGVLLAGPYGTGKTLTAYVAARLCEEHGVTFIYVKDVTELAKVVEFAQLYQPAMIFAEDIDQTMQGEDRNNTMNEVLNTLDGITAKGTEIVTVLTTNHLELINRAMLRPGRLDAVIAFTPPDERAADQLVRLYSRELLAPNVDTKTVAAMLAGQIPAVIRETVERAKLAALSRADLDGGPIQLTDEDLRRAAEGLLTQVALVNNSGARMETSGVEVFAEHLAKGIAKYSNGAVAEG